MAHYKHYFVKYSLQDSRDKKFGQRAQKSLCLASVEEDEEVEDAQNGAAGAPRARSSLPPRAHARHAISFQRRTAPSLAVAEEE